MLVLGAKDQEKLLPMAEAIEAVGKALVEYSENRAITPIRTSIPVAKGNGTSLFMPSVVEATDSLGIKFVSVFPDNKKEGKKTIYGVMILSDILTGEPLAMLEASSLTVLRTGAASGLATKWLAREDASTLAVIGTGAQASGLIEAVRTVRAIREIRLYNRTVGKAHEFANQLRSELSAEECDIVVSTTPDEAVRGADIVVTATNALTPVFSADSIGPGMHVNAIGSFRPDMQELPSEVIAHADKLVVEAHEAALEETGDLIVPIQAGMIEPDSIYGELGEIVAGRKPGRECDTERTVFKSVGLAAMDVVIAKALYDRAVQLGIGQRITL